MEASNPKLPQSLIMISDESYGVFPDFFEKSGGGELRNWGKSKIRFHKLKCKQIRLHNTDWKQRKFKQAWVL